MSQSPPSSDDASRRAAVAIAYTRGSDELPRVVAKGRGALAEQILDVAFAHGVAVREDPDLVEILKAIELECEVPLPALAAIAEILTRVYRANSLAPA